MKTLLSVLSVALVLLPVVSAQAQRPQMIDPRSAQGQRYLYEQKRARQQREQEPLSKRLAGSTWKSGQTSINFQRNNSVVVRHGKKIYSDRLLYDVDATTLLMIDPKHHIIYILRFKGEMTCHKFFTDGTTTPPEPTTFNRR